MRVAHADEVRVPLDLRHERGQQLVERREQQRKGAAHAIGLDRILDVHRGSAKMNLAAADFCLRCIDANLGHEIVPDLAFDRESRIEIDVFAVRAQVGEFRRRHETAFSLRFGQRDPNRAPQFAALVLGEERAQFGPAVAPRKRRGVRLLVHDAAVRRAGAVTLLAMSAVSNSIMPRGSSI